MKTSIENSSQLKELFAKKLSSTNEPAIAQNIMEVLDTVDIQPAYVSDKWIYRIVVGSLAAIVLLVVCGIVVMLFIDNKTEPKVPVILVSIASAALGAITGLLAPSPRQAQK
jgi:hypothetical protein